MKENFLSNGFSHIPSFVPKEELAWLKEQYDYLLTDTKKTKGLRSDLSGRGKQARTEKITQIMRPSLLVPSLMESKTYQKAQQLAQEYLGEDMALDFDMMINKPPYSETETPWHQDAAYWVDLPDKRAVSIWIALDATTLENGCMWFVSKEGLEPHEQKTPGAALSCNPPTITATPIPLLEGGCTLHDGYTLHYSGGNSTAGHRRGLILNFRSMAMIHLERQKGVDHTGARKIRTIK